MNRRKFIKNCLFGVSAVFLPKIVNEEKLEIISEVSNKTILEINEEKEFPGLSHIINTDYLDDKEPLGTYPYNNGFSSDYYFLGDDCKLSFDHTEYGLLLTGLEILE